MALTNAQASEKVTQLYRDLLGRDPDEEGLATYIRLAKKYGINRVRSDMESSDEFKSRQGQGEQPAQAPNPSSPAPASPSDDEIVGRIRADFGYLAWALDIPELRTPLLQAARESWEPAKLQGAIYATNWWKTTGTTASQWDALKNQDQAESTRRMAIKRVQVENLIREAGIAIDPARLERITEDSLRWGWDSDYLKRVLGAEFEYKPETATGTAAVTADELSTLARRWAVEMSPEILEGWVEGIVRGERTQDSFTVFLKERAKSAFAHLTPEIDNGYSPDEIFDTYRQDASRTLGVNPTNISILDPKWQKAINFVDAQGVRRMMNRDEWNRTIKKETQYGWRNTANGVSEISTKAAGILERFGLARS